MSMSGQHTASVGNTMIYYVDLGRLFAAKREPRKGMQRFSSISVCMRGVLYPTKQDCNILQPFKGTKEFSASACCKGNMNLFQTYNMPTNQMSNEMKLLASDMFYESMHQLLYNVTISGQRQHLLCGDRQFNPPRKGKTPKRSRPTMLSPATASACQVSMESYGELASQTSCIDGGTVKQVTLGTCSIYNT